MLVDGAEVWQGNTYGPMGPQFHCWLEMAGLPLARHVLQVEALGQNGGLGGVGSIDVTIYGFSCTMEIPYKLFLPLVGDRGGKNRGGVLMDRFGIAEGGRMLYLALAIQSDIERWLNYSL